MHSRALASFLIAEGQLYLAIRACMDAIRCEPYRDTSHLLMVEGLSNGSNGAALILRYKEMLRTELRVGPGTILANLEAELALAGR